MLPDPLHPAIVHFPVVLAFLLPVSAVVAIWAISKGSRASRAWVVPLAIAAGMSLSTWVAIETGEGQDKRIERFVQEKPLNAHEEGAELLLTASIVVMLVTAAGLVRGGVGTISRAAATVASVALVAGAAYVGHTGGQLVYKYGAASAYVIPTATPLTNARGVTALQTPAASNNTDKDE